jgi:hypothetical protein
VYPIEYVIEMICDADKRSYDTLNWLSSVAWTSDLISEELMDGNTGNPVRRMLIKCLYDECNP